MHPKKTCISRTSRAAAVFSTRTASKSTPTKHGTTDTPRWSPRRRRARLSWVHREAGGDRARRGVSLRWVLQQLRAIDSIGTCWTKVHAQKAIVLAAKPSAPQDLELILEMSRVYRVSFPYVFATGVGQTVRLRKQDIQTQTTVSEFFEASKTLKSVVWTLPNQATLAWPCAKSVPAPYKAATSSKRARSTSQRVRTNEASPFSTSTQYSPRRLHEFVCPSAASGLATRFGTSMGRTENGPFDMDVRKTGRARVSP